MAMSVALPPFSTLHADLCLGGMKQTELDTLSSVPCGFEPELSLVKSEPKCVEETMETSSLDSTYTELTRATFSQIKQGHTDLYGGEGESRTLTSWTYRHPEHWEAGEVLDWLFFLAESEGFDGALFPAEVYNSLSGKQLCAMTCTDFQALDPCYGARVHDVFLHLLRDANFKRPSSPETFQAYDSVRGNIPDFAFLECPTDVQNPPSPQQASSPPLTAEGQLAVFQKGKEVKVSLHGLGLYDIDITLTDPKAFDLFDDSDYHSGSDVDLDRSNSVSSEVFSDPMFSDDDGEVETSGDVVLPDLIKACRTPTHSTSSSISSTSSDSGSESADERRPPSGRSRRQQTASKGNHLWEFVRDLLKDERFNPSLVKWEDRELGVFRFVQSEAVAQMWGRKKNNPGMTYEKLSRAMRFCRTAGYFDSVPKTGRFPKKLCFMFGYKAHDWRD